MIVACCPECGRYRVEFDGWFKKYRCYDCGWMERELPVKWPKFDGYRTLNLRILQVGVGPGILWVRVFGRGFHIRDVRRHPPMFSERMGCHRWLTLGTYRLRILRKGI